MSFEQSTTVAVLRDIANEMGANFSWVDGEVPVLKAIVKSLGGNVYPNDKVTDLYRRLSVLSGAEAGYNEWRALYNAVAALGGSPTPQDNKWSLLRQVFQLGGWGGGSGPTPGPSPETQAIISRVEADGGTIHDADKLNTFITALVDGGVYNTSIIDGMWLPGLASKIDGSRKVSKIYDLQTDSFDANGDAAPANQQTLTTAGLGIDGVPMLDFSRLIAGGYYTATGLSLVSSGNPWTVFLVARNDEISTTYVCPVSRTGGSYMRMRQGTASLALFRGSVATYSPLDSAIASAYEVMYSGNAAGDSSLHSNNTLLDSALLTGSLGLGDTLYIGTRYSALTEIHDGPILAVISCPVAITPGQRTTIYNALAALFPSAT